MCSSDLRPEPKRRCDVRQADVVEGLLREGLVRTRVPAAALRTEAMLQVESAPVR